MFNKPSLFYLMLMMLSTKLFSQSIDLGTWNIINLKYNINPRYSLFFEGQIRSLKTYDDFHYYEYKGGINYRPSSNVGFTLAAGSYQTYKEGGDFLLPKNNDEFRIWPQLVLNQKIAKLNIEQRYRAEFRFTSNGFRNRYRYRFGISYPIGHKIPLTLNLSNELFFTDKEPYFERNRLAFGCNYKINKNSSILIGYLHQFDYKINDETGRDFLQIGYYIEIN